MMSCSPPPSHSIQRIGASGFGQFVVGAGKPRAAACAALPWGIFLPPRWGSGKANEPASGKAGRARLLAIGHHWPGLPEAGRWAARIA